MKNGKTGPLKRDLGKGLSAAKKLFAFTFLFLVFTLSLVYDFYYFGRKALNYLAIMDKQNITRFR